MPAAVCWRTHGGPITSSTPIETTTAMRTATTDAGQPVVVNVDLVAVLALHRCDPRRAASIAAMNVGRRIVVVIVDDHELFAEGLALLLDRQWGELFTVGGQTSRVEEAADLVARCDADVAIVDLSMPPLGGVAAIRHIKARHPRTRILALSGTDDLALAEEALRAGADGFLPKTARPEALAGPLWTIAEGLRVIDGSLLDALLSNTRSRPPELLDKLCPPRT